MNERSFIFYRPIFPLSRKNHDSPTFIKTAIEYPVACHGDEWCKPIHGNKGFLHAIFSTRIGRRPFRYRLPKAAARKMQRIFRM
jgi:hypothetical protein